MSRVDSVKGTRHTFILSEINFGGFEGRKRSLVGVRLQGNNYDHIWRSGRHEPFPTTKYDKTKIYIPTLLAMEEIRWSDTNRFLHPHKIGDDRHATYRGVEKSGSFRATCEPTAGVQRSLDVSGNAYLEDRCVEANRSNSSPCALMAAAQQSHYLPYRDRERSQQNREHEEDGLGYDTWFD